MISVYCSVDGVDVNALTWQYTVVELKASMEDQMGDFPRGWIPGYLRISSGFPWGGQSLGYGPGASISSSNSISPLSLLM